MVYVLYLFNPWLCWSFDEVPFLIGKLSSDYEHIGFGQVFRYCSVKYVFVFFEILQDISSFFEDESMFVFSPVC